MELRNQSRPQLHLITPPDLAPLEVVSRVERAVPHGVDVVHLRRPDATAREVHDLALVLQASLLETDTKLVVNDRVDVALAVNAWGVQLGARSLPVQAVRRILGPNAPVGVSVHGVDEARDAESMGAIWLQFGHVYETGSHPGDAPRGPELLRAVVDAVHVPVIAIGGVTPVRVPEVIASGASGVAVLSGIFCADDVAEATRSYRSALNEATPRK